MELERIYPMMDEKTAVDIDGNFQKIEGVTGQLTNEVKNHQISLNTLSSNVSDVKKTIANRGKEIIASEVVQSWLAKNEFKPKEAVATYADLPAVAEQKEIRGVLDTNQIYWYDNGKWTLQSRVDLNGLSNRSLVQTSNITFNIPSQYPTLQAAIDDLSTRAFKQGTTITLMIDAGHIVTTPLRLVNGDYSHFRIASKDAVVFVNLPSGVNFIFGNNAKMPVLSTVFDMQNTGANGYNIEDSCVAKVDSRCGVINAGVTCLYVRSSMLRAAYSVWSGGNDRTAWVTRGSIVSIPEANFNDCKGGLYAVYVSRSSNADLSNSTIDNSKATACALRVLRSRCTFISGSTQNSISDGIVATQASSIGCDNANVSGCANNGVSSMSGSSVDFGSGTANNCGGNGIYASGVSSIHADSATATGCNRNVAAIYGAVINFAGGKVADAKDKNLAVYSGGTIYATNVTNKGATVKTTDINVTSFNRLSTYGLIHNANGGYKTATGVATDTTATSGDRNVSHTLGVVPTYVSAQLYGANNTGTSVQITGVTSTSFTVRLLDGAGKPMPNTPFTVMYKVETN
ncbi:hypothetical protein [Macrococcus bovicus]|uniref:Uncharacterized protein n=1 Tax=Macrococcus bovicus TaxID=69968 RepID=A0A4R6BWJ5_9STAP|nr:hypothetical protein [Macrococcus bovicus]TDM12651.1 hypothetical protein ERX55_10360 [Macrococcus bovicus]